jgi:hypothetical protein
MSLVSDDESMVFSQICKDSTLLERKRASAMTMTMVFASLPIAATSAQSRKSSSCGSSSSTIGKHIDGF